MTPHVTHSTIEAGAHDGPARLIVLDGDQIGRRFVLGDNVVIGRDPDANVVLADPDVSRHHVRIRRAAPHGYLIEDLGSRNGTLLNGVPVDTGVLRFGDKIHVGPGVLLLFAQNDPIEAQILQRQRLEALGRLVAGIAHDFNNMLGAVAASAEYLAALPSDAQLSQREVRDCVSDIQLASRRASELTRGLLSFARGGGQERSKIDVAALCQELAQLARRTLDRSIRIETQVRARLTVIGDRVELHQMLMNLCVNARDAMPNGGTLRIATDVAPSAPESSSRALAVVTVEDTGTGMSPEVRSRIFEPFFTTKRDGAGFGLGLATVAEIASRHGGRVEVDSEIGRGTAFRVYLPITATESVVGPLATSMTAPPAAVHPVASLHARGKILLVDDEDIVRRSARRLLRQQGHEVIEAQNGRAAVDMFRAEKVRPDLVLLDLDMPDLGGRETYALLKQIDSNVRVIIVSGHDDEEVRRATLGEGALAFLRKPYGSELLIEQIDLALTRAARRA